MKVIDLLNKIANGEEVKYVLKGRSAIDDNMSLTDALINWLSINYDVTEDDVNWLNGEVEIIEDEFIDIEELEIGSPKDNPSNKYIVNEYGTKCYLTKHSRIMADKINDLIKNQKVLINKLKEEEN